MKKRILVLLVAILCLVSFASCKKDTPESLYNSAMTAMEEAEGFEAKATIKMDMKMGSINNSTSIEMDIKANGNNMAINMEDYDIVYIDGVMYMDMGAEMGKMKMEISVEDFLEEYGMTMNSSDFPTLAKEKFENVELTENGDVRSFTLTLDSKDIKEIIDQTVASMVGEDTEADFSDIAMTLTFDKDDNLIEYIIKFKMKYAEPLVGEMDMDFEMIYEFPNPGTVPTITAPSDAADYEEMDASIFD